MSPAQAEAGAPAGATASDAVPSVVVVRGAATPEEVAALVAVLAAASGDGADSTPEAALSAWAAHGATLRRPVGHGPGAWRNSLRS
ncbi:MAG TPA: acyl-CoA carboxylase epsilon subunit [Ornithinibacter sp.]|nr:acyl-CoA carboxylase epsilon subunit [Ornithinibacter sp.]